MAKKLSPKKQYEIEISKEIFDLLKAFLGNDYAVLGGVALATLPLQASGLDKDLREMDLDFFGFYFKATPLEAIRFACLLGIIFKGAGPLLASAIEGGGGIPFLSPRPRLPLRA